MLCFDIDGEVEDNVLWLYNEFSFLPQKLDYEQNLRLNEHTSAFTQKLKEFESGVTDSVNN